MLEKDITAFQTVEEAAQFEWLETNGLGGWSSSSVIGCNTRRYHGLLVAATVPPVERMPLVSKMDETILVDGGRYELGTNQYTNAVHPNGYQHMKKFEKDLFSSFTYSAAGIELKKTISMVQDENTVLVIYEVMRSATPFMLELLPLFSVRSYHNLTHANDAISKKTSFNADVFSIKAYQDTPGIFIKVPGASFQPDPCWYYNFHYSQEQSRGLDCVEDLFCYGKMNVVLKEADVLGIIVSTENPLEKNAVALLAKEKQRRKLLLRDQPANDTLQQLVLASDQFIVKRGDDLKTVIAGYHWFTDWARDTMISLPGLTLSTGRFDDAKKILSAFAGSVSMGMLPNRFPDNSEPPEYNTVDGTLWYFIAVYKYLQATGDQDFVLEKILPVLKEITDWHFRGTRYNIKMADDGLLFAGEAGQQLTWMDARIGNWVVTPRMGKPVEVQALWYNALKIYGHLLQLHKEDDAAAAMEAAAEKAKKSFIEKFWYAAGNYLYDLLDENDKPVSDLRPNQIFAISLPYPLVKEARAESILKITEQELYTPVGLRTLPEKDSRYIAVYSGDTWHRDSAYHQGTVWSWLLGPYVDAIMVNPLSRGEDGLQGKERASQIIQNFKYHLNEACIGSVSEIFDAAAPHTPRGCVAQAWGVAEMLRVIKDYRLYSG